jgi:hypothetical protein
VIEEQTLNELESQLADDDSDEALAHCVVLVALVAGHEIDVPPEELNGAARRALLMLAAGGDPSRGLDLHGRAVDSISKDLDSRARRAALNDGLESLARRPLPHLAEAARSLVDDPEIAWRAFSAACLAEMLAENEG